MQVIMASAAPARVRDKVVSNSVISLNFSVSSYILSYEAHVMIVYIRVQLTFLENFNIFLNLLEFSFM